MAVIYYLYISLSKLFKVEKMQSVIFDAFSEQNNSVYIQSANYYDYIYLGSLIIRFYC